MSIPAGMDHDLYPYRSAPARPPLEWPGAAKVAFAPVVYLEHWPYEATPNGHADPRFRDPYGAFQPDYRSHTWREYGNRVGIFRLFEVLDRYGLTATLAANTAAARRYPVIVEEALRRGWDIAAHGDVADAMVTSRMTADQERGMVEICLDDLKSATGNRPKGWIAQDFGESTRTVEILAQAGVEWIAHWPNDDQPYWMTSKPPIVSVPQLSELDDVECLWHRRVTTPRWPGMLEEALHIMAGEGGRTTVIGLHPWIFGMPHRIRYLDEGMRRVADMKGVWSTSVGEIAAHFRSTQPAEDAV